MDTKKTILVSVLTTLATMFIVAVIMHMCCGNCHGKSKCEKSSTKCSSSYDGHGEGYHGKCASYAKSCHGKKSCSSSKSCSSASKSCSSKSKCSKGKSCSKENVTTHTYKYKTKDGKDAIKKVVKVEEE